MKKEIDFRNDPPGKLLFKMAMPAVIAMVVNGLYYLVDAAFVGWGVGSTGLAGLAVIFPLQMFMIAWGAMLGMGTASIVSRYLGQRNSEMAGKTAGNSILLALLSGLLFTLLTLGLQYPLIRLMGGTGGTTPAAEAYMGTLQWGFVFIFLSMVGFNLLRTQGEAKGAARGMILGTVINLILDPLFIFTFDMGVRGAALATVIARMISTVYFAAALGRPARLIKLKPAWLRPISSLIRSIFALGLGNFLGQFCISLAAVVTNIALRQQGTEMDLAAYGVLSRILVFITMPLLGIAQGFQSIAGFNFGAGDLPRVKKVTSLALLASTVVGIVLLAPALTAPEALMSLFSDDATLTSHAAGALRITLIMLPLLGFQIIGFSFFQSVGKPVGTLILSLSRQMLFLLPLLGILPGFLGLNGVWLAYPAADALSVLLSLLFMGRFWQKESLRGPAIVV